MVIATSSRRKTEQKEQNMTMKAAHILNQDF